MKNLFKAIACVVACFSATVVAADTEQLIEQNLKKLNERIVVESVDKAPLPNLNEVEISSGEVLYADDKGEYFIFGSLYRYSEKDGFVNLTERKLSASRKARLDGFGIKDDQMVVYPAKGERKATISVFTDIDCPYCRKLHAEIPALNESGIQVNYLAYPRQGAGTKTYKNMVSIWCAADADARRKAMDLAKSGQQVPAATCENPVLDQLQIGQSLGVTGTPAIIMEDGRLQPGYAPAERLLQVISAK